jgi:hypothetical protein
MNLGPSLDVFWVLYLVNVLQPVSKGDLDKEAERLLSAMPGRTEAINVSACLEQLISVNLVITRSDELYSVTSLGLERLSQFKFGRIRDKNRLFLLKSRFKSG